MENCREWAKERGQKISGHFSSRRRESERPNERKRKGNLEGWNETGRTNKRRKGRKERERSLIEGTSNRLATGGGTAEGAEKEDFTEAERSTGSSSKGDPVTDGIKRLAALH